MNGHDDTALVEREKLAAYFIEAEGAQIVRDMAQHVGDEIHEVLKRHGMTMTTAAGAIGVGVLAGVQALNEASEFARRSVDTEDERASITAGVAELIRSELEPLLTAALSLPARREGVSYPPAEATDEMVQAQIDCCLYPSKEAEDEQRDALKTAWSTMHAAYRRATPPPAPEDAVERVLTLFTAKVGNGLKATPWRMNPADAREVIAAIATLATPPPVAEQVDRAKAALSIETLREAAQHMLDAWESGEQDDMEAALGNLKCAVAGRPLLYETIQEEAALAALSGLGEGK